TLSLRESIYGPQHTLSSVAGLPPAVVDSLDVVQLGGGRFYKNEIGLMPLTSIELTYEPNDNLRLSVGADNIFNQYPDKVPDAVWNYNEERYANTTRAYLNGSPVGYFGRSEERSVGNECRSRWNEEYEQNN